ncbi:MAG TPA: carboxypeptidase-like regulatory domain-containing protein, partial [Kofleriaceae bacterium]|nr:carboxypeptidase-like regulatory domain-containing protein [Kofleriaceae bacterium]
MKRWIGVVVGLVAVVVGVVFWRLGGSGAKSSAPAVQANGVATAMGSAARRADPRMLQRGSIAGTVTDVAKRPIAGARVCADGSSDDAPPDVFEVPTCVDTDAKGGYRIEKLLAASYVVSANAKTYQPALFEATPYGFRLRAGEARGGVDIVLEAGGVELNGTVSDISGGPVAHARVRLSNGETMIGSPAETDQNGQFTLTSWPGGVSVTARADGYTEASGSGTAPGTIDVLLTPAASLSGTVVDAATGAPIEGARVSVEKTEGLTNHSAHSDADGKFRVQGLTPGRYVAEAISEHRYGRTAGSMLVGLGQDVEGAVVKVHPAQRVQGRVMIRGDKQSVCRDGYAHLQGAGTRRWVEGRTDPDGTITIDGVSPGRYSVSAGCGHDSTTNEIEVEDKDVLGLVWEVEVGATVRGRVLNRRGEPIAHVRVTGVRMPGDHRVEDDWVTTRSKSDGRYELAGLREGTYILDLETTKALAPRGGFTVEVARGVLASMDKVIEKDLVLEDGGQIDGLVVDEHGKPVRGVAVNARSVDSSWNRDGKSDGDGKFTLTAVHP